MKGHWVSVETDNYIVVYPDLDSSPHSDFESATCPCRPSVQVEDVQSLGEGYELVATYKKPIVLHNAFDGRL